MDKKFELTIEEMNELIHLQETYDLKINLSMDDPYNRYVELTLHKDGWTKITRGIKLFDNIAISIIIFIKTEIEEFLKEVRKGTENA